MAMDKKAPENKGDAQVTPNWEKVLYTPERVQKYMDGTMSGQELHALNGPEMLQMALIGYQLYEQGKYEEARVIFDGLCLLDEKESYYPSALGAVYLAMDELEAAQKCFNRAIKLDPKEVAPYVNRGEIYLREGKIMEAAEDFKMAVDLDPETKDPLTARARLLASAALESIEEAQAEPDAQPVKAEKSKAGPSKKK